MLYYDYLFDGPGPGSDPLDTLASFDANHDGLLDLAELQEVFGGLDQAAGLVTPSEGLEAAASGEGFDSGLVDHGAAAAPADAWLSGNEFAGEAEIGGSAFTSGTWDTSGGGNDVISVDGEVLDLPG